MYFNYISEITELIVPLMALTEGRLKFILFLASSCKMQKVPDKVHGSCHVLATQKFLKMLKSKNFVLDLATLN